MKNPKTTSWQRQGKWYNKLVGSKGHYYHEHSVLDGVVRLLHLQNDSKLLDVGCGQGVLARKIPHNISYTGIDLAVSLINFAKKSDSNPKHKYSVQDATKPYLMDENDFTHAAAILSLQNMDQSDLAIKNIGTHLQKNGIFVSVLNHPCFRIPRQSGWGVGENKLQYRYVNRYMTPLKLPITMHPGTSPHEITWSFHRPLSFYSQALKTNGFMIETIEEWVSDKVSEGKAAKMENRARNEFPLFLAISAAKKFSRVSFQFLL